MVRFAKKKTASIDINNHLVHLTLNHSRRGNCADKTQILNGSNFIVKVTWNKQKYKLFIDLTHCMYVEYIYVFASERGKNTYTSLVRFISLKKRVSWNFFLYSFYYYQYRKIHQKIEMTGMALKGGSYNAS